MLFFAFAAHRAAGAVAGRAEALAHRLLGPHQDDQTPRLLYYLDLYDPRTTAFIPHDAPTGADPAGQNLYLLDHQVTLDEASQRVRAISPDLVLMLRWPPGVANAPVDLTAPLSQMVHAVILRDEWIFDGKKLAQAIEQQPGWK
jgi:hypothetical protein